METNEMKDILKSIMFSKIKYGLTIFAYVKENENYILKKFLINDELCINIKSIINSVVEGKFLSEDCKVDIIDNISDDRKVFYEIVQNDDFCPFRIINNYKNVTDIYSEKEQDSLVGLLFRINLNDQAIWFYQHIYPVRMIKRSKSLYAMLNGNTYVTLDRDILKIDSRFDFLIINESIITSNIKLLQTSFGFDKYIRSEAEKTISIISELDIVSDTEKIFAFSDKQKLTNAKKLLKAKNSPVLNMKKDELINSLKKHPRYKDKFHFENNKILINSQKDVNELIKMLNDDIVRSELTNREYDSSTKYILEPLK